MDKKYRYKFSIIMSIYNVDKYIEEAIESLVRQKNLIFEKDIQLILVNDGSLDNSEDICLKYKYIYPENIVYIKKENGGLSSARNKGLEYIEGKYVNFFDPDDLLDENTLYEVYKFFESNYNYIDVVSIPIWYFEKRQGPHILNYKFGKSRVINILQEYNCIQLSIASAFIKNEVISTMKFDEKLTYAEDAKVLNRIFLDKLSYGVVSNAKYWYRIRYSQNSIIQNGLNSKGWYNDSLNRFSIDIINYTKNKLGYIPKYIQYLVMYDLQWKIKIEDINILNALEQNLYLSNIKKILLQIDDKIILEQRHLWPEHKIFCFSLKYGKDLDIKKVYLGNDIHFMINDTLIYKLSNFNVKLDFINVKNQEVVIEGSITNIKLLNLDNINVLANVGDDMYIGEPVKKGSKKIYSLGDIISEKEYFKISIPLRDEFNEIKLFIKLDNTMIRFKPKFNQFVRLYEDMKTSYFLEDKYCVVYTNNTFTIIKQSLKVNIGREFRFLQELIKNKRYKIAIIRFLAYMIKYFKKKEIWLFMDRIDKADDNAEAMFEYCNNQVSNNIKKYFIINKSSKDYERISKIGNAVAYGSYKQKLLMAISDKMISSHVDESMRSCLKTGGRYIKNLMDFKFIFLQHGIIKDDLSDWLRRYNKNIDLFITSAGKEYNSVLNYNYGYGTNTVKLTGLPRYDKLENDIKKQIVIMPTWRTSIVKPLNQENGIRPYCDGFKETKYFEYYNKLINDERIINKAKFRGYKILFFPHPNIQQQIQDFKQNDYVSFVDYNTSYNKIFCESDLLITDYSSVAFDFAYLKKPVLYYQFDYKDVFESGSHLYSKGYFDYETMGFGEVCYDYEKLVMNIIDYIENNCKMKEKYIKRVDSFYEYTDKNNCKRVYNEIVNMK